MTMIGDGMAVAVGQEAVEADVRSRPHDAFDHSGKKPMAPAGFHYFPTSIRPYVEELVSEDKEFFREYMRTKGLLAKSEISAARLDHDGDAVVVAIDKPVEWHHSDFDVDLCSLVMSLRQSSVKNLKAIEWAG